VIPEGSSARSAISPTASETHNDDAMSYAGKRCVVWGGGLALLLTVGCASPNVYTRPTSAQISAADEAVRVARARGADRDTSAAPFLNSAERQLAEGRRSLEAGDNYSATWLLARAAADGELSQAMVERSRTENEANSTESQLTETRNAVMQPPPPPPPEPSRN
jgi:hypothetical protein